MFFKLLLVGSIFVFGLMAILWMIALRIKKASIVDPAWAASIAFLALFYTTFSMGGGVRFFLAATMGVLWGMRLCFFILFYRVLFKEEDGRYKELLSQWGDNKNIKLFKFYMLQALVAVLFSVPYLIISLNPARQINGLELFGFMIWLGAFFAETVADLQLEYHKRQPENKGKTCRIGLWSWSRHPNYFFEFLVWCGVAIFTLASPWGFIALLCPIAIFHFVYNVTGIPKTEEQSLRSRGDEYRKYQQEVSKFFPRPPQRNSTDKGAI
jgi:steroid 5-alpha reductase family enzyme